MRSAGWKGTLTSQKTIASGSIFHTAWTNSTSPSANSVKSVTSEKSAMHCSRSGIVLCVLLTVLWRRLTLCQGFCDWSLDSIRRLKAHLDLAIAQLGKFTELGKPSAPSYPPFDSAEQTLDS